MSSVVKLPKSANFDLYRSSYRTNTEKCVWQNITSSARYSLNCIYCTVYDNDSSIESYRKMMTSFVLIISWMTQYALIRNDQKSTDKTLLFMLSNKNRFDWHNPFDSMCTELIVWILWKTLVLDGRVNLIAEIEINLQVVSWYHN